MRAADRPKPTKSVSRSTHKTASASVRVSSRHQPDPAGSPPPTPARPRLVLSPSQSLPAPSAYVPSVDFDRRLYPRAALRLPLRLTRVAGQREVVPLTLLTRNLSSSGVYFLCPRWIEPGTPIELEVALVDRPFGQGSIQMATAAHIVRVEPTDTPGWHGLAASFDDITFRRDDLVARRFLHF